ncbi:MULTISPECIES: thioesterase II family protein [Streptomyces]|uniref:Thioesterase II family protein n=2 Tax=Streptomyces TaxID=1883 RepID=A0ABV9IUK0_9ACTN
MTRTLTLLHDPADPELDLVVMPFGGGGPTAFLPWTRRIRPSWRLSAVCLPGRGARFTEPFHTDAQAAAQEVAAAIRSSRLRSSPRPLVLFGHSLGALLARDVAALVPAELLCVAGCSPPTDRGRSGFEAEPEHVVREFTRSLGLADPGMLEEVVTLTTPVFRADLALYDGYRAPATPLACDVVAYYGDRDDVPAQAWSRHTTGRAAVVRLPGDHYFVQRAPGPLVADLERRAGRVPPLHHREVKARP